MAELKTINGNTFEFRTEEKDFVSVLTGGYIITKDGKFIDVKDAENHSDIFTSYLRKYLEDDNHNIVDTLIGSKELTSLNHIVYLVVKESDIKESYGLGSGTSADDVVLLFPSNSEEITKEAAESCLHLISTNKSIFGNYEKVHINYHNFDVPYDIKDEIVPILQEKVNSNSKTI